MVSGTIPRARSLRASFFPRPARNSARTVISCLSAMMLLKFLPPALHEERGNAGLLVDRLNRLRQKRRDAQNVNLPLAARRVAQRYRVRRHDALDLRVGQRLARAPRQNRVRETGVDAL